MTSRGKKRVTSGRKVQAEEDLRALRKRIEKLEKIETAYRLVVKSQASLEKAFETMQLGVTFTDLKGKILYTNPAEAAIHGYAVDELIGEDVRIFAPQSLWSPMSLGRIKGLGRWKRESINVRKDGTAFPVQLMSDVVTGRRGQPLGIITTCEDITERKQMEAKLLGLSVTDELTGIYNRRGFFNLANHLIKMSNRSKSRLFLLYADLNELKDINDTYGHQEGDRALKEVAAILKTSFRESDIVARIGGDEFVVFPIGNTEDCIDVVMRRLEHAFEVSNLQRAAKYRLSVSLGVTIYDPGRPCTIDQLLADADRAMYMQKRERKGVAVRRRRR